MYLTDSFDLYEIHAYDADGTAFVFAELGVCTRTEAKSAMDRAWSQDHECLGMWIEQQQ